MKRKSQEESRASTTSSHSHFSTFSFSQSLTHNNWRRKWLTMVPINLIIFLSFNLWCGISYLIIINYKLHSLHWLNLICRIALRIPRICGRRGSESWRGNFVFILRLSIDSFSLSDSLVMNCILLISIFPDYSKRLLPDQKRRTQRTGFLAFSPFH